MRILQVSRIPNEIGGIGHTGGVATHAWELSTHLAKRGHKVAILAENFVNPSGYPVITEGVEIYGFSKTLLLKHLLLVIPNLLTIVKLTHYLKGMIGGTKVVGLFSFYNHILRHFKPDIVHIHHLEMRFHFIHAILKDRIPSIATIHSFSSIKFPGGERALKNRRLIADNLQVARNIILVSKLVEKELKEFFGEYHGISWVIHNPTDIARYHPIAQIDVCRERVGLPKQIPLLLFVGGLVERKGVYVMLEAARLLREKGVDFQLVLVGDGPEREGIGNFVTENGIGNIVRLEGAKSYPELLYYYNSADLFVMPSFGESFGLVYLEAMACGIPAIGTSTTGMPEIVPSEDYGIIISPGDAVELAEAIEKGLNKNWDRDMVTQYAQHFSWETNIIKFENVYASVLQET